MEGKLLSHSMHIVQCIMHTLTAPAQAICIGAYKVDLWDYCESGLS